MKKKTIYLLALTFSQWLNAQSNYLDLINKFEKLDWYGSCFFDNVSTARHLEYRTVDSLLANSNIKQVILKYRPSGFSIHKRRTKIYTTAGLTIKNHKYIPTPDTTAEKRFNSGGKLISIKDNHFTENYKYDSNGDLIEITRLFSPYNKDSSSFQTWCLYSAYKWIGKYDADHRLITEETYWDNGKTFKSEHRYIKGILTSSVYNTLNNENLNETYIYEKGLLVKILIFDIKNHNIRTLKYKWIIKNEA